MTNNKKKYYEDIHIFEVFEIFLKYKLLIIILITLSICLGFFQTRNIENNYLSSIKIYPLSKATHEKNFGYFNHLTESPSNNYQNSTKKIVKNLEISDLNEEFIYELRNRFEFISFFKKFDRYDSSNYKSVSDLEFDISNDISNIEIEFFDKKDEKYWLIKYINQNPVEFNKALIGTLDRINSKIIIKTKENFNSQIKNLENFINFNQINIDSKINFLNEMNWDNNKDLNNEIMKLNLSTYDKSIITSLKQAINSTPLNTNQDFKIMNYSLLKISTQSLGNNKFKIIFIYLILGIILSMVISLSIHYQKHKK